jgi:hypothetical protein
MATSPIYSWPEPDNTDLVKNGALAIRTLGNAIDTTMGTMVAKTVVDAKGDLIVGTAADTVGRLAVAENGSTIVADSSTSTGLRYQASMAAGKNAIINGGLDNWQRGTSFVPTATGGQSTYTADRWQANGGAAGRTITRQTTSDTTNVPNITYCLRLQRDSGNTSTATPFLGSLLPIPDSMSFIGQTVTLSFYARKGANFSATSSLLNFNLISGTNTSDFNGFTGTYTGVANPIATSTKTLTTTWQRFTATGTIAATATQFGVQFWFDPTGTAGAADYFEVTGVQIEVGSVATQFTRAGGTIQGELAACQRYYWRNTGGVAYSSNGTSLAYSTTKAISKMQPPVSMRIAPTVLDFSALAINEPGVGNYPVTALTLVSSETGPNYISLETTVASGLLNTRFYYLVNNNNTAGYVGVSAEL